MKKLAASLLLFACATPVSNDTDPDGVSGGTDTGNPHDGRGTTAEGGNLCAQTESALALDAATSLGVSAAELSSWVSGTHHETLAWQDQSASFGPEHGSSELTIEIETLGARWIERRPAEASGGPGVLLVQTEIAVLGDPCADSIALDVRLHLSTAGGALDETVDTTLEAKARDFVSGRVTLPLDMLTGSFVADVTVPNGFVARKAPQLSVELGISEFGSKGQFSLFSEFESLDGQAVGQGGAGTLARFPADDPCASGSIGVAADETVRGVSVQAVLERLKRASPARLDGSSATLQLDFASRATLVCVALDGPESAPTRIEFPGRATLHSSDQRIDGSIDVTLSGDATSGVLEHANAVANDFLLDRALASAAVARYAIAQPLDFSSYDGGAFEFSVNVSNTEAVGALRAYGLDQADCVTNPVPVDPGAQSIPGCRGTDRIALWGVTWSK
jgi:hypothetical protein